MHQLEKGSHQQQIRLFGYDSELNLNETPKATQSLDNVVPIQEVALQKEKCQYDNAGRVVKVGRFTYQYDACGRAVSKTEQKDGFRPQITRFNWDEQDRLTRIELPNGERWRYRYDAFGRRLSKECEQGAQSEREIQYRYDGAQVVQQILKAANGDALQTTEYIYEPGSFRPVAQVNTNHVHESEQLHYVITDQAGTPRELCREDGDIVWRGQQGLWQRHRQQQLKLNVDRQFDEAANDPVQCDLRYQGQLEDCESGLYYNLNRYYDADSGQYLSPDPIGMAGGLRPQAYVHNPMDWGDPLGLAGCGSKNKGYNDKVVELDPTEVSFSQATVDYQKRGSPLNYDQLVESMKKDGWNGKPLDVVRMPDGAITSADNTRVLAAREAGINIQAHLRNYTDKISPEQSRRFQFNGELPKTWGEAIEFRVMKQSTMRGIDKTWSERFPLGSLYDPEITGKK
ncbi:RHS repeat domain-containing protein [Celerinatantimonas sp. YJH-8]|uniref:RHS repeat domain-containing protein n=1 Tax=Celerinatantimonas sp. YJH-8 TaxID=3228714 RepID=UPI0038C7E3E0